MDTFRCSKCGADHRLSEIEPVFARPDAYFEVPASERGDRTWNEDHLCVLWAHNHSGDRYFLRVLLPFQLRGEARDYCWGVWAEVAEADFANAHDSWDNPRRAETPAFPGQLANELSEIAPALGLLGAVQLSPPGEIPRFTFVPGSDHPLARQQREGIFPEQAVEWASRTIHA